MPGRRLTREDSEADSATMAPGMNQASTQRSVRPRREGPPGYPQYEYVRPGDRLHMVNTDPALLALPSAHFARSSWMLAKAHMLALESQWQTIKLFYITMTDFAKLQKSLDREVNPVEVPLEPWVATVKHNVMVHIAHGRLGPDALIQFEVLHEMLQLRIEEERHGEVKETMAAMQILFKDQAKLWLDYNACIPVPYRMKMAELFPWAMEMWLLRADDGSPDGYFKTEAIPEIMEHIVKVYCESA